MVLRVVDEVVVVVVPDVVLHVVDEIVVIVPEVVVVVREIVVVLGEVVLQCSSNLFGFLWPPSPGEVCLQVAHHPQPPHGAGCPHGLRVAGVAMEATGPP